MWQWLVRDWRWPAAALFTAPFLLAILPIFANLVGTAFTLIYVQLPIYLLHQAEEHIGDRFRHYVNQRIGNGLELLTPRATFWINCLGVWVIGLLALYLGWWIRPGAGVVAGYLTLINGIIHVITTIQRREYNPGLVTSLLLFLPLGGWCVLAVAANWLDHLIGITAIVGLHGLIVVHVLRRRTALLKRI